MLVKVESRNRTQMSLNRNGSNADFPVGNSNPLPLASTSRLVQMFSFFGDIVHTGTDP